MSRLCIIAVRMLSTLLVLLIFVLGRIPEAAYAQVPHIRTEKGHTPSHTPKKNHFPRHKHPRKLFHSKNFQLKLGTPEARMSIAPSPELSAVVHSGLYSTYSYLFFGEINPPPPRLG